jgi:hypothetical protein
MDTTKLVVGQDVYLVSNDGRFFCQGKVTEVTPEGVDVLTSPIPLRADKLSQFDYDVNQESWLVPSGGDLNLRVWAISVHFDNEGNNGSDGHDGMDEWGFGPWHIDDTPFAERRKGHV